MLKYEEIAASRICWYNARLQLRITSCAALHFVLYLYFLKYFITLIHEVWATK